MMRIIRALLGRGRSDAAAAELVERRRSDHEIAMHAVNLKVDALQVGAERMAEECRMTQEAAALMLARLREDFPK